QVADAHGGHGRLVAHEHDVARASGVVGAAAGHARGREAGGRAGGGGARGGARGGGAEGAGGGGRAPPPAPGEGRDAGAGLEAAQRLVVVLVAHGAPGGVEDGRSPREAIGRGGLFRGRGAVGREGRWLDDGAGRRGLGGRRGGRRRGRGARREQRGQQGKQER